MRSGWLVVAVASGVAAWSVGAGCAAITCFSDCDEASSTGAGGQASTHASTSKATATTTAGHGGGVVGVGGGGGGGGGGAPCAADVKHDEHNCGACGHDCKGGACEEGLCGGVVIATLPSPAGDLAVSGSSLFVSGGCNYVTVSRLDVDQMASSAPIPAGSTLPYASGMAGDAGDGGVMGCGFLGARDAGRAFVDQQTDSHIHQCDFEADPPACAPFLDAGGAHPNGTAFADGALYFMFGGDNLWRKLPGDPASVVATVASPPVFSGGYRVATRGGVVAWTTLYCLVVADLSALPPDSLHPAFGTSCVEQDVDALGLDIDEKGDVYYRGKKAASADAGTDPLEFQSGPYALRVVPKGGAPKTLANDLVSAPGVASVVVDADRVWFPACPPASTGCGPSDAALWSCPKDAASSADCAMRAPVGVAAALAQSKDYVFYVTQADAKLIRVRK